MAAADGPWYVVDYLFGKRVVVPARGKPVTQYRVCWEGYSLDEATWEPEANLPPQLVREYNRGPGAAAAAAAAAAESAAEAVPVLPPDRFLRCAAAGCRRLELRRATVRRRGQPFLHA